MYVASAQFLDQRDLSKYLAPIVIITSLSSFLGFLSSSSIFNELHLSRAVVGLSSGILGVVATTLTALRNAQKFDVKAETFRSAGGQYRILATKLEERIRAHRHLLNEIDGDPGTNAQEKKDAIAIAKEAFLTFFADSYERIMTAQSEMKYFPPQWKLKEWVTLGTLRPNPIDQPMAKFRDPGYKLNKHERERALYLLTNGESSKARRTHRGVAHGHSFSCAGVLIRGHECSENCRFHLLGLTAVFCPRSSRALQLTCRTRSSRRSTR